MNIFPVFKNLRVSLKKLGFKPCTKVAPITGTGKKELAKSFFDFLRSSENQNQ